MYNHFKSSLDFAGFIERDAMIKWKALQNYAMPRHSGVSASNLRMKVLQCKRREYKTSISVG